MIRGVTPPKCRLEPKDMEVWQHDFSFSNLGDFQVPAVSFRGGVGGGLFFSSISSLFEGKLAICQ